MSANLVNELNLSGGQEAAGSGSNKSQLVGLDEERGSQGERLSSEDHLNEEYIFEEEYLLQRFITPE